MRFALKWVLAVFLLNSNPIFYIFLRIHLLMPLLICLPRSGARITFFLAKATPAHTTIPDNGRTEPDVTVPNDGNAGRARADNIPVATEAGNVDPGYRTDVVAPGKNPKANHDVVLRHREHTKKVTAIIARRRLYPHRCGVGRRNGTTSGDSASQTRLSA